MCPLMKKPAKEQVTMLPRHFNRFKSSRFKDSITVTVTHNSNQPVWRFQAPNRVVIVIFHISSCVFSNNTVFVAQDM